MRRSIGPQGEKGDTGNQGPQGRTGSEGPEGDIGPQGEKGDRGESGVTEFSLIEVTLGTSNYDDDNGSYVIVDDRISPDTVIEVYMKFFTTDTGNPFYIPFDIFVGSRLSEVQLGLIYVVTDGGIVFVDEFEYLAGEDIAILITGTSE